MLFKLFKYFWSRKTIEGQWATAVAFGDIVLFFKCNICTSFVVCKVFASTLLSSLKQARSLLRQQRAALDKVTASAANQQLQSLSDVSQSDSSRLLDQYREAELQVGIVITCDGDVLILNT